MSSAVQCILSGFGYPALTSMIMAAYMLGTWDARYPHVSGWTKMLLLGALISTRDQGCLDGHERASQVLVWEAIPIAW